MKFILDESQELIRQTVQELLSRSEALKELRRLRASPETHGHSSGLWRELVALGLPGLMAPVELGGQGLGAADCAVVTGELGRALAPVPFVASAVLGMGAVLAGSSEGMKRSLVPRICDGTRVVTLAHDEGAHHDPLRVRCRVERRGTGYQLDGMKVMVMEGAVANDAVVVARESGEEDAREGLSLFLVALDSPGVKVMPRRLVDSRGYADIEFCGVQVEERARIGARGEGADVLEPLLDLGRVMLCAEMLGGAEEVFARTMDYLKTRRQFGAPIGSFQALQHRAARLFCELELAASVVRGAALAMDGADDLPVGPSAMASAAKARLSDTYLWATAEAVQMHGGIGVTDELDIGLFLKRAQTTAALLGGAEFHRDRFGTLRGY